MLFHQGPLQFHPSSMSEPSWDSDEDDPVPSSSSSDASFDDDEVNRRMTPYWPKYSAVFKARGFKLDTVRDVKEFYNYPFSSDTESPRPKSISVFVHGQDEDALCPDAGLPDNLFRGMRTHDARKIVVKAVHLSSREYQVIQQFTQPPLSNDPMNHTIPVLDLIIVPDDELVFIVMEEWFQLVLAPGPCVLGQFLASLRQCFEHVTFMHKNKVAHLDISSRNILTDHHGHYAYIDYELSRGFEGNENTYVDGYRGTEVPPECEAGGPYNPYKVDVWALAVLVLRSCKMTGFYVPELMQLIKPMLDESPDKRPSMICVLGAFDRMMASIPISRLREQGPQ